jgi:hypothetical protein
MPKKLTREEFIKISKETHNNFYNYDNVIYINNITKVEIICPTHGNFKQIPKDHKKGRGCWECGKIKCVIPRRHTLNYFIKMSNIKHKNKCDYSLIKSYKNNRTNVKIICKEHDNIFSQLVEHHLNGLTGCIKCQQKKRIITCLELYGVEYAPQVGEFKEKIKKTCLERYGEEHPLQCDQVFEKVKNTNLERYGVEYGFMRNRNKYV